MNADRMYAAQAEAERKRRLEYYRNLQTYNMKEELVL